VLVQLTTRTEDFTQKLFLAPDGPRIWVGCEKQRELFAAVSPWFCYIQGGYENNRDFRSIYRFISENIQELPVVTMEY